MRLSAPIILLSSIALVAGCGDSREQAAVARIMQRKDPGFIRLVNLTPSTSALKVNGKEYGQPVEAYKANKFLACPKGEIKVTVDGVKEPAAYEMKSQLVLSAYLVDEKGKKTVKFVEGEPRNLPKGMAQVAFLTTDSTNKYTAEIGGSASTEVPYFKPSSATDVSIGKVNATISVNGRKLPVSFDAIDQGAYTVVVQLVGGKPVANVLSNHPDRGISMAGASG